MVKPAMQLAAKIPDVHVQLWASALLKGKENTMMQQTYDTFLSSYAFLALRSKIYP